MARKYSNKRIRYVESIEDFNHILELAYRMTAIAYLSPDKRSTSLRTMSYLVDNQRYIELTTRFAIDVVDEEGNTSYEYADNNPCTWLFDKTGKNDTVVSPSSVYRKSTSCYKPKELVKNGCVDVNIDGKPVNSAKPILGFNPKYDNTEHMVYCYDLNSAYAMVLKDKIIDTENPHYFSVVGDNQVGFINKQDLEMVHCGYADVVYDLIDSPYKEYCMHWYSVKKNSPKGSKEKKEAKDHLVQIVGLFQNHNPYLRAYVVNTCNEYIQSIINRHPNEICYWNTDAVYSTVPLDDLELGEDIGQFKLEYQGLFRQKGFNYQKVETNEVSYRGVCNVLFKEGYNLLTDGIPKGRMPFEYDKETRKVIRND